jgi:small Trp-rich protein
MYLAWIGAALVVLKWLEVRFLNDVDWWWILAPLVLAFIYFEFLEPMFGFDKKKAHDENDKFKAKRLKQQLKKKPK